MNADVEVAKIVPTYPAIHCSLVDLRVDPRRNKSQNPKTFPKSGSPFT